MTPKSGSRSSAETLAINRSAASAEHFIMATAGHVDHGKSALIKALTGTDPDRLPEEKVRGITIDLGFACLELAYPSPRGSGILLGIVDVPGHEDFVANMVAGVGSVDLALLVVAADDGWMPQTEEHLQILTYSDISRAVVALTKIDLVRDEQHAVSRVREKLRHTPFEKSPIVLTSVVNGRGLADLKTALAEALKDAPRPPDIGKPRLPVDRVFQLQGVGTVVTGTLTGGVFNRGQSVVVQPSRKQARIRTIQTHGVDADSSGPGTRTALNLPDLEAARDIKRGDIVTLQGLGMPGTFAEVLVEISSRAFRPLKDGLRIKVHHGTAKLAARITLYPAHELRAGERRLARLRLEAPAFLFAGDHFILRDWAEQLTLAGGIVLDPDPGRQPRWNEPRLSFLEARARQPGDVSAFVASAVTLHGALRRSELLLNSRFSGEQISQAASQLASQGAVTLAGDFALDPAKWKVVLQHSADAIDAYHRVHPERKGLPLNDLRAIVKAHPPFSELFDHLVENLIGSGFSTGAGAIYRTTHQPALPAWLEAAGARIRTLLAANPFNPPSRAELAPDPASKQALQYLLDSGELVAAGSELVITAENMRRAIEVVRGSIRAHGPSTVAALREALGSTRRVVVPLLERLDREGVTLRRGDTRILRA